MTTQRDDMAGPGAADPAPGQVDPPEPMTGQIVPPPRVESEPDRPTDAASPDDPAADPDRVVLDDPVQADDRGRRPRVGRRHEADDPRADDLGPAENGESAVDSETVTDREPDDAPPLMTDGEPEDEAPLVTDHEPADAPPLVTDEVPDEVIVVDEVVVADETPAGDVAAPGQVPASAPVADTPDTTPAAALAEQQWPAIQSMFVDDPRGAVERAAAAAGEVAASLIATLEREQDRTALLLAAERGHRAAAHRPAAVPGVLRTAGRHVLTPEQSRHEI